jgi:Flp pilus assembly protein CpaB
MKKQWILVSILAGLFFAAGSTVAMAQHQTPNQQPGTAAAPAAPTGDLVLGSVNLPKGVSAEGKPLPAGTYQVRLTAQEAKPDAVGASENLERWVEFVQGGTVKAREVVSIVPQAEVKMVVKDAPPPSGTSKVQTLKGNDYVRVWINRAGTHYLIHLPASASGM